MSVRIVKTETKKQFRIDFCTTVYSHVYVDAKTEEEAREMFNRGDIEWSLQNYDDTQDDVILDITEEDVNYLTIDPTTREEE